MNGDRREHRSHLGSIEVIDVIQIDQERRAQTNGATAEIARRFDVASRGDEAIRLLDGCMSRLHEVRRVEAALKGLSASEQRAALECRRQALGGEPA